MQRLRSIVNGVHNDVSSVCNGKRSLKGTASKPSLSIYMIAACCVCFRIAGTEFVCCINPNVVVVVVELVVVAMAVVVVVVVDSQSVLHLPA